MFGQFHPGGLEPPDDAAWHLAAEAYEKSGDLVADALDWVGTVEHTADLIDAIVEEFLTTSQYATAIEDKIAGVR
jgi:hypothetical protein